MLQLEKITDGIYTSEATRELSPTSNEVAGKSLQNTLGHAESEEIFAAFMYASKPHGQWVAMGYDRLYEQACKHIVLTSASVQRKNGAELPDYILKVLDAGEYYPSFTLGIAIRRGGHQLFREETEAICETIGEENDLPIYQLREDIIRKVDEAQRLKAQPQ